MVKEWKPNEPWKDDKESQWWKLAIAAGLVLFAGWLSFTKKQIVIPGPKWFGLMVGVIFGLMVAGLFAWLMFSFCGMSFF